MKLEPFGWISLACAVATLLLILRGNFGHGGEMAYYDQVVDHLWAMLIAGIGGFTGALCVRSQTSISKVVMTATVANFLALLFSLAWLARLIFV